MQIQSITMRPYAEIRSIVKIVMTVEASLRCKYTSLKSLWTHRIREKFDRYSNIQPKILNSIVFHSQLGLNFFSSVPLSVLSPSAWIAGPSGAILYCFDYRKCAGTGHAARVITNNDRRSRPATQAVRLRRKRLRSSVPWWSSLAPHGSQH